MAKSSYSGSAMGHPFNGSGGSIDLVEGLARIAEGVDSGRNAAIDGNLEQDLLDLLLGQPVLQGALDVQLQLVRSVQGAEHRQIDDRACAPVDAGSRPQGAPAEFGRPFRHRAREVVGSGNRLVDIVFAEHLFANLEALFE